MSRIETAFRAQLSQERGDPQPTADNKRLREAMEKALLDSQEKLVAGEAK